MNNDYIDISTKSAAFKISQILSVFDNLDPRVQDQAEHITMQRVHRLQDGDDLVIDGTNLIFEVKPPEPETPAPNPPEPEILQEEPKPATPESEAP